MLISAGPGSGKTQTIINKIGWLLYNGAKPQEIVYVTFTRNAATEAKNRLEAAIGREMVDGITISTAHSLAFHEIKKHHRDASIAASNREVRVLENYAWQKTAKEIEKQGCVVAGRFNQEDLSFSRYVARLPKQQQVIAYRCLKEAEEDTAAYTFDRILQLYTSLEQSGGIPKHSWVFVDEVQDCGYLLTKQFLAMGSNSDHLVCVGDLNQSIYGTMNRFAPSKMLEMLQKEFHGITHVVLTKNFRSCNSIIELSDRLQAAPGMLDHTRHFGTGASGTTRKHLIACEDYESFSGKQAKFIVKDIQEAVSNGESYGNIAVTFRQWHVSSKDSLAYSALQEEFRKANIPFIRQAGSNLTDALSQLRNFTRCLRTGGAKVSKKRGVKLKLMALLCEHPGIGTVFAERFASIIQGQGQIPRTVFTDFVSTLYEAVWADYRNDFGLLDPDSVLSAYRAVLDAGRSDLLKEAMTEEFAAIAKACILNGKWDSAILDAYDGQPVLQDKNAVVLTTVHKAKGLEYDRVYIVDCATGSSKFVIPTGYRRFGIEGEEDNRKLYVAVTRARKHCTMIGNAQGRWPGALQNAAVDEETTQE